MPGETQDQNHSYTFRFKLVYTEITSSITVNVPVVSLFTWSQFMDSTLSARQEIINYSHLHYEFVVCGQPDSERAPAIIDNLPPLTQGLSHHGDNNNNFSFYIRPTNTAFLNYLRENCPNPNLIHSLSVSDEYEMFMRRNDESAEADTEDDSPEPTSSLTPELSPESAPEPTCENMDVVTNEVPTFYQGTCCICYEVRNLSDHWQCYIPEGANRHGICDQCFQTYRSSSSRAHGCPVCRQPLGNTNYGEVAPPVDPPGIVYTNYSNIINPPEPAPSVLQDFPYGGSGAAGPQDSEGAAASGPHNPFLHHFDNYSFNPPTISNMYDNINNIQNVPQIEIRNQDIIIRNIPYNEMVNLQSHNPNNNSTTTNDDDIVNALINVINRQINNLRNNNRINASIFNQTFYNIDNNSFVG